MSKVKTGIPALYSRRSDGKIQSWQVEVEGNKFRAISGIVDGQKVTSEWTVCAGKNEGRKNATTGEAQAEKEARALWKKKQDEGYKTDVADVDVQTTFWPMLAEHYDDFPQLVEAAFEAGEYVMCQPKLDGMRCAVNHKGMWSRNGKPVVSAPHVFEAMRSEVNLYLGATFDGELYADKFADDFNKIISLAKKGKPSPADLVESAEHLQYHVYDVHSSDLPERSFYDRHIFLRDTVEYIDNPSIVLVETVMAEDMEHIETLFGLWRAKGYEGAMIRLDRPYEHKRSRSLLKFKQFQEEEFTVVDVIEGVGNKSGMAGALAFKTAAGRAFTAAIMGDRELFRGLLRDRARVIGRVATVQFQNYTPDGSPRFPCVKSLREYD